MLYVCTVLIVREQCGGLGRGTGLGRDQDAAEGMAKGCEGGGAGRVAGEWRMWGGLASVIFTSLSCYTYFEHFLNTLSFWTIFFSCFGKWGSWTRSSHH